MKNYILDASLGNSIDKVAEKAKAIAKERDVIVEFMFNNVKCLVDKETFVDNLVRTYLDSHIMGWKEIGPKYEWEYSPDTQIELYTRKLNRAKERKASMEKQKIEDDKKLSEVTQLTKGVTPNIIPGKEEEYRLYVENNSKDGYSKCCVEYGEQWMKLMQVEIGKGREVKNIAEETQKPLGYIGITGFMYGCIVKALSHFWVHGEELRKWHNKEYNHEGAGVVNPAVLTIGTK